MNPNQELWTKNHHIETETEINSEPQNPEPPDPEPVEDDDILSKEEFLKIMTDFKNESVKQFELAFKAQFP